MNPEIVSESTPWIYDIELTNRCPMKCVMCPRTEHMSRGLGDMDQVLYRRIIDELIEITPQQRLSKKKLRLHHFGESLVHPEFAPMIRYASERGIKISLSINPLMLKEKIADELLGSGIDEVLISLDGHDNASFEKIRGVPDAYEDSVIRLEKFVEKKVERGLDMTIKVSMIDFGLNRNSIEKVSDRWRNLAGVDDYRQKVFLKWDGAADTVNELADETTDEAADEKIDERGDCEEPWKQVAVLWDGRVVPCCFDYDGKYLLGDLRDSTLMEVWNGEPMQELRRAFIARQVENELCRSCEFCPGKK